MKNLIRTASTLSAFVLLSACGTEGDTASNADSSASLRGFAYASDSVVTGFRYDIATCGAEPGLFVETASVPLLMQTLPSTAFQVGDEVPFDADSAHNFADHFAALELGCYVVTATPIDGEGNAFDGCTAPSRQVELDVPGVTEEIVLVSQCEGTDPGAIDSIASLNHEPDLLDVNIAPSKFTDICAPVSVCASASDEDNDPVEFEWTVVDGSPLTGEEFYVVSNDVTDGVVTQCIALNAPTSGTRQVQVTVYDLFDDEGTLVRAEDWLDEEYGTDPMALEFASHAELIFPIHVSDLVASAHVAVASHWTVSQGGMELGTVAAYSGALSASDMYDYRNASYHGSNDVPAAVNNLSQLFFYRDTILGVTSLVAVHDAVDGSNSGGSATMGLTGLGNAATLAVADDNENTPAVENGVGNFSWNWVNKHTDGMAISNLAFEECIVVSANFTGGIDTWGFGTGDLSSAHLPLDKDADVVICPVLECVPPGLN